MKNTQDHTKNKQLFFKQKKITDTSLGEMYGGQIGT